jgi:hypothetical protein
MDQARSEQWRRILTGEDRGLARVRRALELIVIHDGHAAIRD